MKAIVALTVNGDRHEVAVPEHWTLLEALRYALGLTGSKQGCDKGDCGACTVLLDDIPVLACITPVREAEGHAITTVEGLAGPGALHPLQQAFAETGAAQCGFCTPGILMSAWGLLLREPAPGREEIAEAISGNLCRCTGYTKIFEAIEVAAERLKGAEPERRSGGEGEWGSGRDSASAAPAPVGGAEGAPVSLESPGASAGTDPDARRPNMLGQPGVVHSSTPPLFRSEG